MMKGTVKWFDKKKGYGFISPEGGEKDVFVHISSLLKTDIQELTEGQKVSFEIETNKGRQSAANISLAD